MNTYAWGYTIPAMVLCGALILLAFFLLHSFTKSKDTICGISFPSTELMESPHGGTVETLDDIHIEGKRISYPKR